MYLFFDTETTGLPADYKASFKDVDNWPRIIQMAWAVFLEDGTQQHVHTGLILPDGWEVPSVETFIKKGMSPEEAAGEKGAKFWIDNGFTQQQNISEGNPIAYTLKAFINELNACKVLIAHNMSYDFPVVACEMFRANIKASNSPLKFCTKEATTDICKLPSPYGKGYKWPKLEELHRFLFDCDFEGAHDAKKDVLATAKCFFELKRRNLINI